MAHRQLAVWCLGYRPENSWFKRAGLYHTAGNVAQYEKQALKAEESGLAEPSLVELTPLPDHLSATPPQSSQEGVMNWLHDSSGDASPPQSHVALADRERSGISETAPSTPQPHPSPQPNPSPLSHTGYACACTLTLCSVKGGQSCTSLVYMSLA